MADLEAALRGAIRQGELNAKALIDSELMVRDLKTAIRDAIGQIDRRNYTRAQVTLKQALDENPWPLTKRRWERG